MVEHKFATILRAIADGKQIQYALTDGLVGWADKPAFATGSVFLTSSDTYRVKPEPVVYFLNVYSRGSCEEARRPTKALSDSDAGAGRLCCLKVTEEDGKTINVEIA